MIQCVLTFPILILGLYGFGEWLRSRLSADEPFSAGRIGRSFVFGILAHGLIMTLLGFLCILYPIVAATFTALPFIIFWKIWLRDIKLLFGKNTWTSFSHLHKVEIIFIFFIVFIALLRGFNALAPNISWDATSHHYLVPSVWLKNHSVSSLLSVVFSYYPSLTEMGIAGTMALGTDLLSNLYGWLFGVVAVLLLIEIPARHFSSPLKTGINYGRFSGIVAALIFTLFPGVGVQTSGGYVDLPLAIWVLAAIDFLLEFNSSRNFKNLIIAAFFSGAALSTKHIGLLIFPGFLLILIWQLFSDKSRRIDPRSAWKYILIFIGISLILPLPWYIRSAWLTGNPFYPFGIFGLPTPPHPPFTAESWIRPDYTRSLFGFITYWLYLTFEPTIGDALGRNYSLILPLLFPLVIFIPKLDRSGKLLAILAGFTVLIIYALFPVETRYHLPFLAPIALVLGLLAGKWVIAKSNFRFTTSITIMLLIGIVSFGYDIHNDLHEFTRRYKVVLNLEPEDRYLLRESPLNYGVIHYINTECDYKNMRVLFLEPRVYRCKSDWVTWVGMDEPVVPQTPEEGVAITIRNHITYQLLGDDVALKAMMYYNIIHQGGWDLPGLTLEEMIEYLRAHPDEDAVHFTRDDLNINFLREDIGDRAPHFTNFWMPREVEKERYPTEITDGVEYYTASRLAILTDPVRRNQYSFVRAFEAWQAEGGLEVIYSDGLTVLWKYTNDNFMRLHPDVDWSEYDLQSK
ncbi:MAG: glycosyltransferase family 39 protein [bacterium]|nr:glycosyltransferase family 39 protein [bacterium]